MSKSIDNRTTKSLPENWSIGVSLTMFDRFTFREATESKEAGIDSVEVFLFKDWLKDMNDTCTRMDHLIRCAGLNVWSVHLPFGWEWDISNPESSERENIIEKYIELMDQSSILCPRKAVIHPSYEPIATQTRKERIKACNESLLILTEKAAEYKVQLAVECLPRTCLGNTSDEITALIDGNRDIGVCCDLNHLLSETPQDFIKKIGSRIVTIHASDYDGIDERHWLPGRGITNWPEVIKALEDTGYNGPFMFELSQKNALSVITPKAVFDCWADLLKNYRKQGAT